MQIAARIILNIVLVWLLARLIPEYVVVTGGIPAIIVIGVIISILNLLLRPILVIITFPLRILTHIIAAIIVNMVFLWVTEKIMSGVSADIASLDIKGGFFGFLAVSAVFGLLNWILKSFVK